MPNVVSFSTNADKQNTGFRREKKAQTHELKIHLALKIKNEGRSAHNKINIIRTHQKIVTNNYNTIFCTNLHMLQKN